MQRLLFIIFKRLGSAFVDKYFKGCFYIILSAVIFGCMPLMAKNIYSDGVNAITLVLLRNVLALPIFYLLMHLRKVDMKITNIQLKRITLLSIFGSILTPTLLFYSYNYISSGMATTLHFVYPVFVLLGCAIFFHEKIGLIKGSCVLLCSIGMLLFYTPGEDAELFGAVLAFLSGIAYATYIIYLDKSGLGEMDPFKLGFYIAAICSVLITFITLLGGTLILPKSLLCWVLCFVFSMAIMVGAVVLFQVGTVIVGPQRAAILSTFEPITGILVGIAVFGEPFGLKTALGSVSIISAVLLLTIFDKKTEKSVN